MYILKKKIPFTDSVIAVLIICLPFLFYTYELFPDTPTWEGWFFTIDSGNFMDIEMLIWMVNTKVYVVLLLSIWFVSCKHWWKYAILVPLIIEVFKFFGVLDVWSENLDEIEYFTSLPVTVPFVLFLIFLSRKMKSYSKLQGLNTELSEEIDDLFLELNVQNENKIDKINTEFRDLKNQRQTAKEKEYLNKLIVFRKQMLNL